MRCKWMKTTIFYETIAWTFSSGWKSNPVCNLNCVDCWIQFDNIACVLTCRILFRTGYRDHFCFLYIYNQPGKRMYCYSNPQKINMLRKRTCISMHIHQVIKETNQLNYFKPKQQTPYKHLPVSTRHPHC